jgi:hypothetical protein
MNHDALRPWPRVKWDAYDLEKLSEALLVMNPSGFRDADSQSSYIRSLAERELYRFQRPIDVATGGWQVCFYHAWDHLADRYEYVAIASLTPHVAWDFATQFSAARV